MTTIDGTYTCLVAEDTYDICAALVAGFISAPVDLIDASCTLAQYKAQENSTHYACYDYPSKEQKMAGLMGLDDAQDAGNIAWMLSATALVFIMTPGLGM